MAKCAVLGCVLLLAFAYAAQRELVQDLGEVETLQDDSSMGTDVVYRISFMTQMDNDPAKTASKSTYKIKIIGTDGDTGNQELVTHPGYSCGAKSDAECMPGIDGLVTTDDDGDRKCACDPSASDYNEDDAKWNAMPGKTQHAFIKAADVGELTQVKITTDAAVTDGWTPLWLKINMNDMASGLGNGIYYMDIGKQIDSANAFSEETGKTDDDGNKVKMADSEDLDAIGATHKYGIIKCEAASCEEMEKRAK
jgi:hypothetical protein